MEAFSGVLRMVNPAEVVVDPVYQRDEKIQLIYAISADFRWEAFGAPVLFERDNGRLYAADGQQRIASMRMMDDPPTEVPAIVFPMRDVKDEAEIYVRINEYRRQLSAMEKHKGKVAAEEPAALAIHNAVERSGFSITPGGKHINDIQAIGTLNYTYNVLGEDGVYEVLMAHRTAWPETQVGANMLRLLTRLILEQGENYDRDTFTDKLSHTSPNQLRIKAKDLEHEMGGTLGQNLRRAVTILAKL